MVSCSRCGQTLTAEESKARGMGPVCARKADRRFSPGTSKQQAAKNITTGSTVAAVSTVEPHVGTAYGVYKGAKFGKELYDSYEKAETDERKKKNVKLRIGQESASQSGQSLSEKEAAHLAKNLRNSIESSGGFDSIKEEMESKTDAAFDKETYADMFENTVETAATSTSGEGAVYIAGEVV